MITTLDQALEIAEAISRPSGGHFVLYKFTYGWKFFWGTPDMDGTFSYREAVYDAAPYSSALDAVTNAIQERLQGSGDSLNLETHG